ncbi:MAG: methyltransferase domain-containing protein [bacterium]
MEKSPDITDYDKFSYDYSKYWKNREYEHMAELYALSELMKNVSGKWFIDIGGSYGRNLNIYQNKYENKIICDYSIGALQKAKKTINDNKANKVFLVAANAYNLPFRPDTFDGLALIRVLHHIENVPKLFEEINRVSSNSSLFFLEYANKNNIKAVFRELLKFNPMYLFKRAPFKHKTQGYHEGSDEKSEGIILNFHPQWIRTLLVSRGYKILNKRGVSFLRIPFLKKYLSTDELLKYEIFLQKLFGWTSIPPSIFLKLEKKGGSPAIHGDMKDILACPKCKSELRFSGNEISCKKCNSIYKYEDGIYDLRFPLISK